MENLHKSGGRGCPVSLGGSPSVRGHAGDKSRLCPVFHAECFDRDFWMIFVSFYGDWFDCCLFRDAGHFASLWWWWCLTGVDKIVERSKSIEN